MGNDTVIDDAFDDAGNAATGIFLRRRKLLRFGDGVTDAVISLISIFDDAREDGDGDGDVDDGGTIGAVATNTGKAGASVANVADGSLGNDDDVENRL